MNSLRGARWLQAIALLTFVGTAACHREQATDTESSGPPAVTVLTARPETFRDVITANGTIVPSAIGDMTVSAPDAATIAELPKKEGDTVVAGDVLVRFDIASITQMLSEKQLALLDATNRFNRAKTEADRQSSMFDRGLTPRVTLDASKAAQATAQSAVSAATADFDAAKILADHATVKATFSGTVIKVWHAVGDQVMGATTDPVLRVVDSLHVQAAADIPSANAARLVQGQNAIVHSQAGDVTATGAVLLPPTSDANAPTRQVRVAFSTPTTFTIDTPVTLEILVGERAGAIMVPVTAVQKDADGVYVMVAGDDGRAHRRDVRLGVSTKDVAQIANGVSAGERVITGGLADLTDNEPIAAR